MQPVDVKVHAGCGGCGQTVTTVGKVKPLGSMGPCPSGCGRVQQLDRKGEIHTPTHCPAGVKKLTKSLLQQHKRTLTRHSWAIMGTANWLWHTATN
jgi:hypothetical protein